MIDSGAIDHMTSTPQLFSTYSSIRTPLLVSLADGSKIPAISKGQVVINSNLVQQDMLVVPSFPVSLLSSKKLCSTGLCCAPSSLLHLYMLRVSGYKEQGDWTWSK